MPIDPRSRLAALSEPLRSDVIAALVDAQGQVRPLTSPEIDRALKATGAIGRTQRQNLVAALRPFSIIAILPRGPAPSGGAG